MTKETFTLTTDPNDMDIDVIHQFISQSYWAKGIPKATLTKAINNSLCFGVFNQNNQQVAFARMITDRATFAYLADVFVIETHRGRGLSRQLMSAIAEHAELQGLRRMMLATRDAHGLYQQYGFEPVSNPEILMQNWQPNIYSDDC